MFISKYVGKYDYISGFVNENKSVIGIKSNKYDEIIVFHLY